MYYRENNKDYSVILEVGDIFYAAIGTEHVAHPIGEARILVIEKEGSV
jgi:mannose-6-phosphate isomerase-like protein (cupin superfamily)